MLWQTQLNHRQTHRNTVLWSQSATCRIYSSPLVLCTCCQVNNHGEARRQEEEFFPPKKIWEPRKSRLRLLFKKLFFNKVYEYELLKTQCNFFLIEHASQGAMCKHESFSKTKDTKYSRAVHHACMCCIGSAGIILNEKGLFTQE